jgi:uncharacterized protein involved in exopolysaccharide biosynthesis
MSADLWNPGVAATPAPRTSLGWLEFGLPLWHHKFKILLAGLLGGALAFGGSLFMTLSFSASASFVVQPALRPSQAGVANTLPAVAGLIGGGSPVDLHVAILRSRELNERIVERFELVRLWQLPSTEMALRRLNRRVEFSIGRREGLVSVQVEDEMPQRAAGMANEYVEELRNALRRMTHEEAQQRRRFFDEQLAMARTALDQAQQQLQASGFDQAALRTEPKAVAEAQLRLQAELSAAELRLAAVRRVRTERSSEVQQVQTEIAALRGQLAAQAKPAANGSGEYVARMREYRKAEALVDAMARQAEAARVDAVSEPLPLQWLDRARVPVLPSRPVPLRWALGGLLVGAGMVCAWVLLRHRRALRRLDVDYQQRLGLLRGLLDGTHKPAG